MALSLIATPGLSTSNSYCTVAEADDFLLSNVYATAWPDAQQNGDAVCVPAFTLD